MIVRRSIALIATSAVIAGAIAIPSIASAAPTAPAPAAVAAVAATGQHPFYGVTHIVVCKGENSGNAPRTLDLDCRLGLRDLTGLKWKNWGANTATATGTLELTTKGRLSKHPVTVSATKIAKREATQVYTSVTYTFTRAVPKGHKKSTTVSFPKN